jgi:hypothetical protein
MGKPVWRIEEKEGNHDRPNHLPTRSCSSAHWTTEVLADSLGQRTAIQAHSETVRVC